jgi:hypothetical protein
MTEPAPWRINLLRCGYLLLVAGLGLTIWPAILDPAATWGADRGVVVAMLGALSGLALLGLRHPLKMLPLLFWEIGWKALWLGRVALPMWASGRMDASTGDRIVECLLAVLIALMIPWDHVWHRWVKGPGEPWRR